ncbi:hypothetical protein MsAm2_02550 [Methanolapillus ohkumae]|uniref:Uncharacterized protein n=1 Tax=Methanolapillus ohkumae TaxID=3028298 RepID=A0AA96V779_9EURY|nr:hypothetical protein MsAm2_02550 [Methanosarcinaceae archaeon Am2]
MNPQSTKTDLFLFFIIIFVFMGLIHLPNSFIASYVDFSGFLLLFWDIVFLSYILLSGVFYGFITKSRLLSAALGFLIPVIGFVLPLFISVIESGFDFPAEDALVPYFPFFRIAFFAGLAGFFAAANSSNKKINDMNYVFSILSCILTFVFVFYWF